jgi:hypothetical protein
MKTKSSFIPVLIISTLIAGLVIGYLFIYYGTKDIPFDAKEYAETNHCPYEFGECPSAQQMHLEDSLAYISVEYVLDSLVDRTIQLETQLAGCEFQDHSKIRSNALVITRDNRGLISVKGNNFALDYLTDAEFFNEFGYHASK